MRKVLLFLFVVLLSSCDVDRGYEIIKDDGKYMLVKSWVGTDTTTKLERSPEEYRCKYIGYRTSVDYVARWQDYSYTIYGLCGNDTIVGTQTSMMRTFKGVSGIDKLVNKIEIGDSILISKTYYPYKIVQAEYIFSK